MKSAAMLGESAYLVAPRVVALIVFLVFFLCCSCQLDFVAVPVPVPASASARRRAHTGLFAPRLLHPTFQVARTERFFHQTPYDTVSLIQTVQPESVSLRGASKRETFRRYIPRGLPPFSPRACCPSAFFHALHMVLSLIHACCASRALSTYCMFCKFFHT